MVVGARALTGEHPQAHAAGGEVLHGGDPIDEVAAETVMCRKRPFGTGGRWRLPASAAVCRILCLILWFAYVESACKCRAPNSPDGLNGRIASVIRP